MSAQEEDEIKEAYSLFAEPMDGEKNGVLPIDDVKSALMYVCFFQRLPAQRQPCHCTWKRVRLMGDIY